MKVLLVNGSGHAKGCTYTALAEAAGALEAAGVETEFVHIGTKAIRGCIGCGKCREAKRCVFDDDPVNEAIEKARACDGFIFGSPVYYASPNGAALAFLDRLFYAGGSALRYKPGAAVVSARRGGTTAALDALNKYFTINCMPVVSSQYWNQVHGNSPEEVRQDEEGMQTMRTLGESIAYSIRNKDAGLRERVKQPEYERPVMTNFIRKE